jgi:hypothetical protein
MTEHATIIDLDDVVIKPIQVKLNSKLYDLPGSVHVDTALELMSIFDELQNAPEDENGNPKVDMKLMTTLFEKIAGLLVENNEGLTIESLKGTMNYAQWSKLLKSIVGELFASEEEAGNPSPPPSTSPTTPTS